MISGDFINVKLILAEIVELAEIVQERYVINFK